jgi:hypothetical protein
MPGDVIDTYMITPRNWRANGCQLSSSRSEPDLKPLVPEKLAFPVQVSEIAPLPSSFGAPDARNVSPIPVFDERGI